MGPAIVYSLKVWVISIFLTAVLIVPLGILTNFDAIHNDNGNIADAINFLILLFVFGLFFSFPALVVFTFISTAVAQIPIKAIGKKLLLALVLCAEVYFTLMAFGINAGTMYPYIIRSSIVSVIITILIIKPPVIVDVVKD